MENKVKKGFTLVEIMLVISIIAILFVVLIPRFGFATDKAKETGVKTDFRAFQTAAESVINEKSFKRLDDGNLNTYLNEYLDKTLYFTNNVSLKENPYGYNYRVALNKNIGDEGSGTLEFISIKGYGATDTYSLDESSAMGTKLVLTVSGGSINSEIIDFTNGDSSLVPGDKTPVSIQINKMPKTNFTVGDSFTYAGLEIKVMQADGTSRVSTNYTVIAPSMSVGTHSVTVKFNENTSLTTQYSITVKEASSGGGGSDDGGGGGGGSDDGGGGSGGDIKPQEKVLQNLAISNNPSKMSYKVGETFSTSGLVITAYFSDGSSKTVTSSCSYSGTLTKGQTSITFTYNYNGVSKSVTLAGLSVTDNGNITPTEKTLTSLTIQSYPSKMSYKEGEYLNISGLVIKANFSDSTSENVTSQCVYNSSLLVGQTSVIFEYSYNGLTKSVTLMGLSVVKEDSGGGGGSETVKTLSSISIGGHPTLLYNAGQNFNTTGLSVTAYFSDGTTADVTSMITHDGYNLQVGTTYVNIFYDYGGIRKSSQISITVKKLLTSIAVQTMPLKTTDYLEGENVNTSGLQVVATFSDGSVTDVTSDVILSNHTSLSAGWTTVKISYTLGDITKNTTFQVYAKKIEVPLPPKLESISVTKMPTKTVYWEGEVFDDTGIEITAYYDNGTNKTVTTYTFNNHTSLTAGTRNILVTYIEDEISVNTSFNIVVKVKPEADFTRISVVKDPTKTTYYRNEKFDATGMVVQGYYPDELELAPTVIDLSNITFLNDTITTDPQYIVLQYERVDGQKITYQYQVHMAGDLESIEVTKNPDKLEYLIGEAFDITGLELTAKFADGLTSVVTPTSYSTDPLKDGQTFVTLSYIHNGIMKTVDIPISVRASVSSIKVETPPTKISYRAGSSFDKSGMIVKAVYVDNTEVDVTDKVVIVNGENLVSSQTEVIIKYTWVDKTVTCKQKISVVDTVSKAIAAGNNTSFFIDSKENVYAFGQGNLGQLGTGVKQHEGASRIVNIDLVKEVIPSFTGNFTMFLRGDGTVYAAGENTSGQLGIGNSSNTPTPTKVKLDGKVKKVVTGTAHTLFLMADNSVYATGLNSSGQLGLSNTSTNRTSPERITGIVDVVDIEASGNHSFAITKTGRVYVFGDNGYGQLGTNSTATQYSPYPVDNTLIGEVVRVYAGPNHTVFESKDGRCYVTGYNNGGQLALGDTTNRLSPTYCDAITACEPIDMGLGIDSTRIVCVDKSIKVAGANGSGQLMTGNTSNVGGTLKDVTVPDYYEIAFGLTHNICSDKIGEIQTQGSSTNYACGLGDTVARYNWNYIFNARGLKKILTGTNQIWIKDAHDTIWVGGKNNNSQLANGNNTQTGRWLAINTDATLKNNFDNIDYVVIDLMGNSQQNFGSLFVMKDGSLYASGVDSWGNLGLGSSTRKSMTKVNGFTGKVKKIIQYDTFTGVINTSNQFWGTGNVVSYLYNTTGYYFVNSVSNIIDFDVFGGWTSGNNYQVITRIDTNKQLFGGTYASGHYPLGNGYSGNSWNYNTNQTSVIKTVNGPNFTVIARTDGSVWSTGLNGAGQLGVGSTSTMTQFTRVLDETYHIKDLVLGGNKYHGSSDYYNCTFAINESGEVYATGAGANGQLGVNNTSNVLSFAKVPVVENVTNVYTGNYYTIFKSDNKIWATGRNNYGQLGIGTTTQANIPQEVQIDATQVEDIRTYKDHVIYEMKDGTIRYCGKTDTGFVGNTWLNTVSIPTTLFEYEMVS